MESETSLLQHSKNLKIFGDSRYTLNGFADPYLVLKISERIAKLTIRTEFKDRSTKQRCI